MLALWQSLSLRVVPIHEQLFLFHRNHVWDGGRLRDHRLFYDLLFHFDGRFLFHDLILAVRHRRVLYFRLGGALWRPLIAFKPSCNPKIQLATHGLSMDTSEALWAVRAICCEGLSKVTPYLIALKKHQKVSNQKDKLKIEP